MGAEYGLSSHLHASTFGSFPSLASSDFDQFAFKFSKTTQYRQHQSSGWGRCVGTLCNAAGDPGRARSNLFLQPECIAKSMSYQVNERLPIMNGVVNTPNPLTVGCEPRD